MANLQAVDFDVHAAIRRAAAAGVTFQLEEEHPEVRVPAGDVRAEAAVAELRPHRGAVCHVLLERAALGERIANAIDWAGVEPPPGWLWEVDAAWRDFDLVGLESLCRRLEGWSRARKDAAS